MVDLEFIENDLKNIMERVKEYRKLGFMDFCPELDDPEFDSPDGVEDFMDAIYTVEEGLDNAFFAISTIKEEMEN